MKRNKSKNRKKKQKDEESEKSSPCSQEKEEKKQKARKSQSQNQRQNVRTRNRVQSENQKREQKQEKDFQSQIEEAKQKIKDQADDEKPQPIALKKEIVKGRAAVDEFFILKNQFHVYQTGEKIYDCLLNQTNIVGANNNNKFYIAQVLESDSTPYKYYFYTRWGRIGQKGQNGAKEYNLESCLSEYEQKIYDKTITGDYKIIEKFYPGEAVTQKSEQEQYDECVLPNKVKDLIKLMFDIKMMDRQMLEIGYDSSKMPLGKLGEKTIKQGYTILQSLSKVLDDKKCKGNKRKEMLEVLSSEFFSYIPHNFGFSKPPVISDKKEIKDKLEMLASLEAIEIATKLLEEQKGNKFEAHYSQLKSKISYVEPDSETYEVIEQYLMTTHGKTHSNFKLKIQDIFEIDKVHQTTNFKDVGNRMLLWHGSRLTNFVGIISQGLRIAPPEAPCTGYMFGKGIYFADSVSKSANYCCANRQNPTALILLCDVSLGKWQERTSADYNANELPESVYSTKGVGKAAPSQSMEFNDAKVPLGPMEELKIQSDLLYNEYIVYDVNQVKLKYLIKIAFVY